MLMMDTSSNNDLIKQIERYKNSILKVDPPESDSPRVSNTVAILYVCTDNFRLVFVIVYPAFVHAMKEKFFE